jgi:altronate dehydratase
MQLTGYRRCSGQVGIRNHVVVLPVDDISNTMLWPSRIPTAACSSARTSSYTFAR